MEPAEVAAAASSNGPAPALRVFCVSDIHTDYPQNMAWIHALSLSEYQHDALVLAGDVSDSLPVLEETLLALTQRFKHVFFLPGNHELWVKRKASTPSVDSMAKLHDVAALCARLRVHTQPQRLCSGSGARAVWVVPLLSWHHASFDTEPDLDWLNVPPVHKTMTDFAACSWPAGLDMMDDSVAAAVDALNDAILEGAGFPPPPGSDDDALVITASHFLPRLELCPEKRFLYFPNLPKGVGSTFLRRRVATIKPHAHVYGHTHFGGDTVLDDGVRYIQAALAYPAERVSRGGSLRVGGASPGDRAAPFPAAGPLMVLDTAEKSGGWAPKQLAWWSDFYETHERQPLCRDLPSWAVGRYALREEGVVPAAPDAAAAATSAP